MTDLPATQTDSAYRALNPAGQARVRVLLQALRPEPLSPSLSRRDLWGWLDRSSQQGLDPQAVWEGVRDLSQRLQVPLVLDGQPVRSLPAFEELNPPAENPPSPQSPAPISPSE